MADKEIKDIRQFVTKDGSSGFKAEKGRYHLYVQYGCPFAHRLVLMLLLLFYFKSMSILRINILFFGPKMAASQLP